MSETPIIDSLEQPLPFVYQVNFGTNRGWSKDREISHYGLSASSINESKQIYKRKQLLMMADSYHNNGTIRTMVNKRVDYILSNRIGSIIEKNDIIDIENSAKLEQAFDEIMTAQETHDFRNRIEFVNKNCQLHDKLTQLCINNFVFGRALGGIDRQKNDDFPFFGEPVHLKVLNTLRIKKVIINETSGEFEGYHYDFGLPEKNNVPIPAIKLLPMWYNDANIYDNTPYQGMSAIWPILGIAQSNGFISDEDIPEACKTNWAPQDFLFVGDKTEDAIKKLPAKAQNGSRIYHNQEKLRVDKSDMRPDVMKLSETRMANMKVMCIDFGFPMFLLFEDTANFATAQEVMQAYRAGVLERDRTWLRGILEKYWFDPMLADHLRIKDLTKLNKALIKVKAAFEEISFETRKDIIDADVQLVNLGVLTPLDLAKDIDARPEIIERLENMDKALEASRQAAITAKVDELNLKKQALKQKGQQQGSNFQK